MGMAKSSNVLIVARVFTYLTMRRSESAPDVGALFTISQGEIRGL